MNKAVTLRELLSDRFNTGLTNLRVLKKLEMLKEQNRYPLSIRIPSRGLY